MYLPHLNNAMPMPFMLTSGDEMQARVSPELSESSTVIALQGVLERLIFAFTVGLVAMGGNALLWVISLPSVALHIVRWTVSVSCSTK